MFIIKLGLARVANFFFVSHYASTAILADF